MNKNDAGAMRNRVLSRQLTLLALLHSSGWMSLNSIATKTGVTTRTTRRDLATLEEAHFAIVDHLNDDGIRRWKLKRGAPCPLCNRDFAATD